MAIWRIVAGAAALALFATVPASPGLGAAPTGAPPDQAAAGSPGFKTYGTSVRFVDSPTEAAKLALKEDKLLFVLHVAGDFEDSQFT